MNTVRGLSNVSRWLRDKPNELNSICEQELERAVREAEYEAKQNAPVDTGKHRQSIVGEREGLRGKLTANMEYSPYIEFGTGASVNVPPGFEDLAIQFKGKGKNTINLPARPHIIPAATKAGKNLKENIKKRLSKL